MRNNEEYPEFVEIRPGWVMKPEKSEYSDKIRIYGSPGITQVLVAKEVNELICSSFQVYLPRCISTYVFLCNANSNKQHL